MRKTIYLLLFFYTAIYSIQPITCSETPDIDVTTMLSFAHNGKIYSMDDKPEFSFTANKSRHLPCEEEIYPCCSHISDSRLTFKSKPDGAHRYQIRYTQQDGSTWLTLLGGGAPLFIKQLIGNGYWRKVNGIDPRASPEPSCAASCGELDPKRLIFQAFLTTLSLPGKDSIIYDFHDMNTATLEDKLHCWQARSRQKQTTIIQIIKTELCDVNNCTVILTEENQQPTYHVPKDTLQATWWIHRTQKLFRSETIKMIAACDVLATVCTEMVCDYLV